MRKIWVLDKENPKVTCSYIQYRTDDLNLYRIVQSLEVLIEIDLSTMNSNYSSNSLRSYPLPTWQLFKIKSITSNFIQLLLQ